MIPSRLDEQIVDLYQRIDEINRRARNRKRKGTIAEVGEGENAGKYRVKLSEQGGKPFLTGWIQSRVIAAGSAKIDVPRRLNEQVDVISENGDLTDAEIDLSSYSEENPRDNADNALVHIKAENSVISVFRDSVTIDSPNVTITASGGHLN